MQKTWKKCKKALERELSSEEYNAWINPLEFSFNKSHSGSKDLFILAPNAFIKEHVRENYDSLIRKNLFKDEAADFPIVYELSSVHKPLNFKEKNKNINFFLNKENTLNENYTFDTFVEGKSNNIALAAAKQVSESKNAAYNPLFIYGGVGLGKTHLMHAVGNKLKLENKSMNIVYVHSERFVSDMVKCLQLGSINDFKNFYRSVDALLIDDIQFFAGKEQSQEELFHTFNTLLEGGQQMILTCDKYPKEIDGLEERLKSRLGWGLPVSIEPPELETRVAILLTKAEEMELDLQEDCAFYIAEKIRSNVRELEGALRRVGANAKFTNRIIDVNLIKESLKDLLAIQQRQISIENIQKIVSDYYNIRVSDLLSSKRNRSLARPRQVSMCLSKELTNHSLPEIGDSFGGRDHTTVLHACRRISALREEDASIADDYTKLVRTLTA
ncbi:MAG: chromosomal replication initiator protein DnaA [Gammaproteobacteria bacterium]|nr:MAG: chromosomal replication initiator protein DnaA [Gammaproteobacteria bacterium]